MTRFAVVAGVGAAYLAVGRLMHAVTAGSGTSPSIWPSAGIALAAVMLAGPVALLGVACGAFANLLWSGQAVALGASVAAGAVVQAAAGAYALRAADFRRDLSRPRDVFLLVIAVGAGGVAVGTSVTVVGMLLSSTMPPGQVAHVFGSWWLRQFTGTILVCPFLFLWSTLPRRLLPARRVAEVLAFTVGMTAWACAIFHVYTLSGTLDQIARPYSLFPVFIWTAFRYGQRGQTAVLLGVAALAVWSTFAGNGPFNTFKTLDEGLIITNMFLTVTGITGLVLAAVISSQRAAEAAKSASETELAKREREFRATFELSGAGHWQVDLATQRFVMVNHKLTEITGFGPAELMQMTEAELTSDGDRPASEAARARLLARQDAESVVEKRLVRKDGSSVWTSVTSTVLRNEAGEPLRLIAVIQDISGRRAGEEAIKAGKAAADAANFAKTSFLANMSHEIRTPLNAVLGFSQLLAADELAPGEKAALVERMARNGRLLIQLIDDILDLSKVEAGHLKVERLPIVVAELLQDVLGFFSVQAQAKGLKLVVKILPEAPAVITSDPTRLRQMLLNLVGNAMKFTAAGSVEITVGCWPRGGGKPQIAFVVKDTGCGIPKQGQGGLFHPFVQAMPATARRFGGTGLGLALTRKIAQALGGDVELTASEPGVGSTFSLHIEAGAGAAQLPPPAAKPAESNRVSARALAGLVILVAEDAPDNQLLLKRFLSISGASVDVVSDGVEAVAAFRNRSYDMVLTDLEMPHMDGYELTRELRRLGYQRPIVAITAHAMLDERERSLRVGCDDHVNKPIQYSALIEKIRGLAGSTYASPASGAAPQGALLGEQAGEGAALDRAADAPRQV